jgi:hypothetical protein
VVGCGDASLHKQWACDTQNFDVAISYFGDDANKCFPEARYVHRLKAGKWNGLHAFFEEHPELVQAYDYYWFPDDDLALSAQDADRLLEMGRENHLDLFQPALDDKSYFTHLLTLAQTGIVLRYTNFVEIMAPVMSARLFAKALPTFAHTRTGFGLDFLWPQMVASLRPSAKYGCAIIDAITMEHTRPVGSALKTTVATDGGSTGAEEMAQVMKAVRHRNPLFRSLKMAVPRKRILAARRQNGRIVGGLRHARHCLHSLWRMDNKTQPLRRTRIVLLALTAAF